MGRFVFRMAAFLLLQAGVLALLHRPELPRQDNYLAGSIDKHRRLRAAGPPRILLAGGSNVAFGFDSALLEERLGRTVVNLGLVAWFGPDFLLSELEAAVGPGDIVVLAVEQDEFAGPGNREALFQLSEYRPASLRHLPSWHWKAFADQQLFPTLGAMVRRSWSGDGTTRMPVERRYRRRHFNAHGDYTGHWPGTPDGLRAPPRDAVLAPGGEVAPPPGPVLRRLRALAERCERRGGALLLGWPPRPAELVAPDDPDSARLAASLRAAGLRLVEPTDRAWPAEDFFDTRYHLAHAAARRRTEELAAALEPWLARGGQDR